MARTSIWIRLRPSGFWKRLNSGAIFSTRRITQRERVFHRLGIHWFCGLYDENIPTHKRWKHLYEEA